LNTAALEQDTVHCRNCGAVVDYHFCAVCGQETKLHLPSAGEFLHEFITHYVALEGKLWQSLWLLLRKPGMLTAEYLAGRRARYIQPLRLYLTFSVLFFALFKWSGYSVVTIGEPPPAARHIPAGDAPAVAAPRAKEIGKSTTGSGSGLQDRITSWNPAWAAKIEKFDAMSNDEQRRIYTNAFFGSAPYAMFCLMPVFALFLKLLYLGSGRRYGEHLLFALHTNAFAFLMVGLVMVVPSALVRTALVAWLALYLPFAMQRVYGGYRGLTALRWLVLIMLHVLCLMAAVLSTYVLAILA
jgi:hypothetical protein